MGPYGPTPLRGRSHHHRADSRRSGSGVFRASRIGTYQGLLNNPTGALRREGRTR